MAVASEEFMHTCITCGRQKRLTTKLNDRSTIDQIHEHVRDLFRSYIPDSYCLMFYNDQIKKFVKLNQNQLANELNPFRVNSPVNDQDMENIVNFVELYVIDIADETDTQSGISCHEASEIINEMESKQDVPTSDGVTNITDYHNEDLAHALLGKEQDEIDILMQSISTNDHAEAASPDENHPSSDFSPTDISLNTTNSDLGVLFHALLMNRQPVQTLVNNHSLQPITTGITVPPQNNSVILNEYQPSIELNETQTIQSNRLYFSRDVKPEQKTIYKSDQFNQKERDKTNGYVTRIQGIKTLAQRMSSVWPKIHIPKSFRQKRNVRLVVFAVSEKLENGRRIWFRHRDKGFLPKDFQRDTPPVNPIEFNIQENCLTKDGEMLLDLQMTSFWNKFEESKKIFELDEHSTIQLHSAVHDPSSPRLFCILKVDQRFELNTICLSDFIRSKSPSKRSLPTAISTNQTNATVCKRARAK